MPRTIPAGPVIRIQRFGSVLRRNVHVHALVPDRRSSRPCRSRAPDFQGGSGDIWWRCARSVVWLRQARRQFQEPRHMPQLAIALAHAQVNLL